MLINYFKKLIFLLLACAAAVSHANVVSIDNAKQLAADFFSASSQDRLASSDALDLVYTCGTTSHPLYYVFNARDGKGFIIISADDCTTPVLGYSLENNYDLSSVPPAMKWMMQGLESEIKAAPKLQKPVEQAERRRMARRTAQSNEKILLKTPEWRQESPFNSMIPGTPLTGCVGTAMAMIMKYHNYPERGTGSYNQVNFDVAYDWANMRMDNYRYGYSQAEADAVATLIYHTATSIGTQFGYSGSSAYEVKVPAALINYFGYDPGVSYKKRSETSSQAEFDRLVENDIRAGRPVLYCGQDVTAGHAFVVDGYDPLTGMIHVNWGWGGADGNNNGGWYASTALNPTVSQSHSFNNLTTIIYNIKPGNGNNAAWSPIHITADGQQAGLSADLNGDLTPGKPFTVRVGNLKNLSYDKFSGKITVALFGADGSFKAALSKIDGLTLNGMTLYPNSYVDYSCQLAADAGVSVADGDMIRLATSSDNGATWLPVPGELITINEIPAKGAAPQYFSVSRPATINDATFTGEDRVIRGWNYHFRVAPAHPDRDVVTVKANGYLLTPDANYNYTISNVRADQEIAVYVQPASEIKEKRSLWVETPGSLETLLDGGDAASIKELTLFGSIDARDFAFIKSSMKLTRLDLSGTSIAAYGSNQANAVPREAFRNIWSLQEVILPGSVNRLNNGCFRLCGIKKIVIPAKVSTYEYNVFNGSSGLTDIYVGNPNAAFINWCVLYPYAGQMTLHCPSQAAVNSYKNKEHWKEMKDIIVDPVPATTDFAFAVMEDAAVKYNCDTEPGRYEKGKTIVFQAEHIEDNDNRMDVYANSTLLKPDAQGNYSVTLNNNTIIHFDLVEPSKVSTYDSPWTITGDGGAIGMITDAVNVLPGVPFTIRVNSFKVTENVFWAAVLTTADGRIKEFISPISNWSAGPGSGFKMNVNCCVTDATVREGNLIRLATSFNKKTWVLVNGANDDVVDALPALNNQTPVYNFTFPEGIEEKANLSGIVTSAVRGRDLTFKITPKKATDVITMLVNGTPVAHEAKSVNYSFIAKEDLNFDIRVLTPDQMEAVTFDLQSGERLWDPNNSALKQQRLAQLRPKVIIKGNIDYTDFGLFREPNAWSTVVSLDLSGATIVADRANPSTRPANEFPAEAFCSTSAAATANIKLKDLKFPQSIRRIGASALIGCSAITELELPLNLYNDENAVVNGRDKAHQGGLKRDCFKGCDNLTTLYCYAAPSNNKVHHIDFNSVSGLGNNAHEYPNTLGISHHPKVTLVVKPEYYKTYTTPHETNDWYGKDWINGWKYLNFNIAYDYPVYGINFDVTRCFTKDAKLDIAKVVNFLGDNVSQESCDFSGKLFVAAKSNDTHPEGVDAYNPNQGVKVYDNGKLLPDEKIASDGSLTLTFYNPNDLSRKDLIGDHTIDVLYLYDVTFNCTSQNIIIEPEEIRNNEETEGEKATLFETFDYYNATAPVLKSVREDSSVRFKVKLTGVSTSEVRPVVKVGETVLSADEDGFYTLNVTDSNMDVNIFAVPVNGATLNLAEVDVIDPAEAKDVTSIALAGDIDAEKVIDIIEQLPSLEQLDLSGLSVALPSEAMAGKETLVSVVLPNAADIEAATFSGCTNLSSVQVPECVDYIGENAFKGCSSLKTLSFTGIKAVGANAFNGCDNLTSVTFIAARPDSQPARVRRRAESSRPDSYSSDAFAGINPNCIIYLDENVDTPEAKANYVRVRTESSAENRNRVYESLQSIYIDPAYNFEALNAFNITEGNTISMDMALEASSGNSHWKALVLPFTPDKVTNAAGGVMSQFHGMAVTNENGVYMAASLDAETAGTLKLMNGIRANTPYIVSLSKDTEPGTVHFEAQQCTVPQTPSEIRVAGSDYDLVATLSSRELQASGTYLLSDDGSAFVEEGTSTAARAAATTQVAPFSVYAVAEPGSSFPIDIDTTPEIPTGIQEVEEGGLTATREGGKLVIYADRETEIEVFNIEGLRIKVIHLVNGRNVIADLTPGVYVISGEKIII